MYKHTQLLNISFSSVESSLQTIGGKIDYHKLHCHLSECTDYRWRVSE